MMEGNAMMSELLRVAISWKLEVHSERLKVKLLTCGIGYGVPRVHSFSETYALMSILLHMYVECFSMNVHRGYI